MFDYLYEWIRNIAFYMVLVTAVVQVLPGTDYKKYIRFFTGLVLILLMAAPVLKIFGMGESLLNIKDNKAYKEEIERIEESTAYLQEVDVSEYLGDTDGAADQETGEEADENKVEVEEIRIGR